MPSSFTQLPIIDIRGLYSDNEHERLAVAAELKQAASDVGFMYIKGHYVPEAVIDRLLEVTREFFAQPLARKQESYIGHSSNHSGYVPEGEEEFYSSQQGITGTDFKESYDVGFELDDPSAQRPMLGTNQWPPLPGFKEAVLAYYHEVFQLGLDLFRGFALALGLPEHTFVEQCTRPPSQLRMVHYPFNAQAVDRQGIGAHTDYECFTLLLPTADGLEVLNGDGVWIDAPVKPGCYVVNVGDMLELLSNGRFVATSHRVRKVKEERYSFPLFCSLDYDTVVKPILPPLSEAPADQYQPLVCGDHLYAQTIHTFRYMKKRLAEGKIQLPDSSKALASFGKHAQ
ncbi:isopenicillin N synthase family dioxygenase [Oceanobacter kriegii]|uniref:isopenicillin N synthase family dioxygenase n=1 Tax=Oceanobacter kriegii TaxID=64972 RepID=UPI00041A1373|nr:2-oxoglutarate and iron-dependent oxygenase domain-containing protein [Oceanobacter kriegii]